MNPNLEEVERIIAGWENEAADHDNVHRPESEILGRCAEEIREAIACIPSGDWQPIETAPTDDGTLILGFDPWNGPAVVEASWSGPSNCRRMDWRRPLVGDDFNTWFITHWIPIPLAPENAK